MWTLSICDRVKATAQFVRWIDDAKTKLYSFFFFRFVAASSSADFGASFGVTAGSEAADRLCDGTRGVIISFRKSSFVSGWDLKQNYAKFDAYFLKNISSRLHMTCTNVKNKIRNSKKYNRSLTNQQQMNSVHHAAAAVDSKTFPNHLKSIVM